MIGAKPAGQASGHQEALASASPGQLIEEAENKAAQILQAAGFAVERQQAELAEELEAEREAAKHRAAMMKARADEQLAGLSSRIQLNVRGTVIECYTMNLTKHEGSLFHDLLLASGQSGMVTSPDGGASAGCGPPPPVVLFLDRNPESVVMVLDFLAGYPLPDWIYLQEQQQSSLRLRSLFLADVQYFGLEQAVAEHRAAFGTRELVHAMPGDTNGVLHYLGTARGTSREYRCPAARGAVKVRASEPGVKHLRRFVSDAHGLRGITFTAKEAPVNTPLVPFFELDSCLALDLGESVALWPNFYSLEASLAPRSQPGDHWLNWRLDGSDDGKSWTVLREHANDDSFVHCNDDGIVSWRLECKKPFQHFAVVVTGPDSTGGFKALRSVKIELYGRLYEN